MKKVFISQVRSFGVFLHHYTTLVLITHRRSAKGILGLLINAAYKSRNDERFNQSESTGGQ